MCSIVTVFLSLFVSTLFFYFFYHPPPPQRYQARRILQKPKGERDDEEIGFLMSLTGPLKFFQSLKVNMKEQLCQVGA